MLIRDIMTSAVQLVDLGATVREATQIMRDFEVGALLVRDGESLVGIVTDWDVVTRSAAEGNDPSQQKIADIMTRDVAHIADDQEVQEAAWLMEIRQVRRLAVFANGGGGLVGIVSLDDISVRGKNRELGGEVLEFLSARRRAPEPDLHPVHDAPDEGWAFSRL